MTVTFLSHSGFLVEWDSFYTLFDFWHGELPALDPGKPLLVFASHSHEDHFDKRIFTLPALHPDTRFVLSHDITVARRRWAKLGLDAALASRITQMRADELLTLPVGGGTLSVRTVRSTDIGVGFLLTAEGRMVYHAGDNNWWHWEDEGKAYCNNMAANYRRSIDSLAQYVRDEAVDAGIAPELAVAMVPMDPRLESAFGLGAEYLLRQIPVKKLFPMHLWEKFDWIERYRAEHPQQADLIVPITRDGETFAV